MGFSPAGSLLIAFATAVAVATTTSEAAATPNSIPTSIPSATATVTEPAGVAATRIVAAGLRPSSLPSEFEAQAIQHDQLPGHDGTLVTVHSQRFSRAVPRGTVWVAVSSIAGSFETDGAETQPVNGTDVRRRTTLRLTELTWRTRQGLLVVVGARDDVAPDELNAAAASVPTSLLPDRLI